MAILRKPIQSESVKDAESAKTRVIVPMSQFNGYPFMKPWEWVVIFCCVCAVGVGIFAVIMGIGERMQCAADFDEARYSMGTTNFYVAQIEHRGNIYRAFLWNHRRNIK